MILKKRLLALILMLSLLSAARAEAGGVVRLHVIAADDSPRAQALKLKVRDAALEAAREMLSDVSDADEAWTAVNENRAALETACRAAARENGCAEPVRCETGVFPFPERRYGHLTLPAGDYRALRVVIGAGEGRNWWCVLYPSLCYPDGKDPSEIEFHSAIWDWFRGLFGT